MATKRELSVGDRIRVKRLERAAQGEPVPEDVLGLEGVVTWLSRGFAGERTVFEVRLSDGRVLNLYSSEIEAAGPPS